MPRQSSAQPKCVRIIYRWRVPKFRIDEFRAAWCEVTNAIHHQVEGAKGSFCLQSIDDPEEVLTIALWDSEEEWRSFIMTERSTSMKRLHTIAEQLEAQPYVQLGDETRP